MTQNKTADIYIAALFLWLETNIYCNISVNTRHKECSMNMMSNTAV